MRSFRALILTFLVLAPAGALQAQARPMRWAFELFGGSAFSFDTPFTVSQAGQPELTMTAEWDTRPFYAAPYYAYRISKLDTLGRDGWALDFTHHKIYLHNRPAEISKFEISHGYNQIVYSKLWRRAGWLGSLGGGMVIGHPESTIRGLTHDDDDGGTLGGGYYLCGVVGQAALGRRADFSRKMFATVLGKATAATCRVPVRDGWAEAPNVALHLNIGVGMRW
ncbi:MAG TPA: hypothetical protein VFI13_01455 [Gemmatimonadales bacterium]|nr:hypothetical protein [Gemmatimonadales bacterium]